MQFFSPSLFGIISRTFRTSALVLRVAAGILVAVGGASADEAKPQEAKPQEAKPQEVKPLIKLAEGIYYGGKERFDLFTKGAPTLGLKGQYIQVPLDHANPQKGTFDLYYRLSENFDRSKPTMIYFNGGPGSLSAFTTFDENLNNFNVIYFDQRGTGFSHLRTLADTLDPANFSSELIARDAELLRWYVGVDKLSVYGQSYGTIPATIYASLFPGHTRALVLEGVIFDGTSDLWTAPYRIKLIQKYYDQLSPEMKTKIQLITDTKAAPEDWFSNLVRMAMYEPDFAQKVDKELEQLTSMSPENAAASVSSRVAGDFMFIDSTFFAAYMFHQIACQELSFADPGSSWGAVLRDGQFVPGRNPLARQSCLEIPGMSDRLNKTYQAINYPVSVPVTYFEGTTDGATVAPNALRHFTKVAKARAQLIFVLNSGHSPVIGPLGKMLISLPMQDREEGDAKVISATFEKALLGQNIDSATLKQLSTHRRWTKGFRLRPVVPRK